MDDQTQSASVRKFPVPLRQWVCYGSCPAEARRSPILLDPLRRAGAEYAAVLSVILRRHFPQIMKSGGLYDESSKIYSYLNANFNHTRSEWTFPNAARSIWTFCRQTGTALNFRALVSYVAFDRATQFPTENILYLWGQVDRKQAFTAVGAHSESRCRLMALSADSLVD